MNGTIRVRILFFASLAEAVRVREENLTLPLNSCVADALGVLERQHMALAVWRGRLAFAVNLAYVDPTWVLADADELALIPPVSGG